MKKLTFVLYFDKKDIFSKHFSIIQKQKVASAIVAEMSGYYEVCSGEAAVC